MEQSEQQEQTPKEPVQPPKVLSYDDIKDIVEYLVKAKSSSYAFSHYSPEDIGQEIRIICMNALAKFNPERVEPEKWQNYFGRCVDNGLKNLKRDNYVRTSSPYKKRYEELSALDEGEDAQKVRALYEKFQRGIKQKLGIIHAKPIEGIEDLLKSDKFLLEMEYKDLEKYLLDAAEKNIEKPLRLLLEGKVKEVSKKEKKKVQAFVNKMMDTTTWKEKSGG